MGPSFALEDGMDPLPRHISWPYFVPETTSNRDAFCRPRVAVQSVSSSSCCLKSGTILEALYRVYEGFWFSPLKLIMTSLFHFEEKIHRKHLTRAETIPLLFSRMLSHVLEHLGFLAEPHQECHWVCEATFTVEKW